MNQPSEEEVGLSSIGELINFLGGLALVPSQKRRIGCMHHLTSVAT